MSKDNENTVEGGNTDSTEAPATPETNTSDTPKDDSATGGETEGTDAQPQAAGEVEGVAV